MRARWLTTCVVVLSLLVSARVADAIPATADLPDSSAAGSCSERAEEMWRLSVGGGPSFPKFGGISSYIGEIQSQLGELSPGLELADLDGARTGTATLERWVWEGPAGSLWLGIGFSNTRSSAQTSGQFPSVYEGVPLAVHVDHDVHGVFASTQLRWRGRSRPGAFTPVAFIGPVFGSAQADSHAYYRVAAAPAGRTVDFDFDDNSVGWLIGAGIESKGRITARLELSYMCLRFEDDIDVLDSSVGRISYTRPVEIELTGPSVLLMAGLSL